MSMNNIFPESMNKIDTNDSEKSLKTIDEYIAYMCERMDFYVKTFSKQLQEQDANIATMKKVIEDSQKESELLIGNWKLISNDNGFSIKRGD